MSNSTSLIHAVQSALTATETHAHRILDHSWRLISTAQYYDLTHEDVGPGFLRTWRELCGAFTPFWTCYAGRSYGGEFIPASFRPHEFLAAVATTSQVHGVFGRSLCQIAFKYGLEVRRHIRQAVPRAPQAPPDTATHPVLVVEMREVPPDSQGGFGFPIPDTSLPDVQAGLKKCPRWDHSTFERVKIEITQEVKRAWAQVPVTIRAMSVPDGPRDNEKPDKQPTGTDSKENATPPPSQPPESEPGGSPTPVPPRYTLGWLIAWLDGSRGATTDPTPQLPEAIPADPRQRHDDPKF